MADESVDVARREAEKAAAAHRRRWAWSAFFAIAALIVVSDQLLKAWIVSNYQFDVIVPIAGDWLRIVLIHNTGGLFGLFQNQVAAFAVMSVVVVTFIVALELRSGWRSRLTTIALALLLGGAIGNFIDRVRLGYVIDFADVGIGSLRWYVFNIADSAVSIAIALLFVLAFLAPRALSLDPDDYEPSRKRKREPDGDEPAPRDRATTDGPGDDSKPTVAG